MRNGWTGGQYSVVRALFAVYLAVHFGQLLPWGPELFSSAGVLPSGASPLADLFPNVLAVWDAPAVVDALLVVGLALTVPLALGSGDRIAAILLWYVWACLLGRNPLIANPSIAFIGWLLLLHAALPRAPWGSWAARGRGDPGRGWRFPPSLFAAAWIVMALAYSYSGYTKLVSPSWVDGTAFARILENPLARPTWVRDTLLGLPTPMLTLATWGALALELGFAPLALLPRLRPALWALMLTMHLTLLALIDFADLSLGMVILHLMTFDPGWIGRKLGVARILYDGDCGLCHRFVRFVLAEDRLGALRLAPLGNAAAGRRPSGDQPDSIAVVTHAGRVLWRSDAVCEVLAGLGGTWRVVGAMLWLVPRPIRDRAYDLVARGRHRLFAPPSGARACPAMAPHLRDRFEFLPRANDAMAGQERRPPG